MGRSVPSPCWNPGFLARGQCIVASKLFQGWGEEAELRIEGAGVEEGWVRRGSSTVPGDLS